MVVVAPGVVVVDVGSGGTGGHEGIWPMLTPVLTEATNEPGTDGSGRASHGSRLPIRTRNSAGTPLTVAVKSNRQFHCSPPLAMSTQRLATTVPVPISWLTTGSRMATGAPTARPEVEPPLESAHPTHVPSLSRTASENGSVCVNGGPAASTPPRAPAMALPVTVPGVPAHRRRRRRHRRGGGVVVVVVVAGEVSSVVSVTSDADGGVVASSSPASRLLEQAVSSTSTPATTSSSPSHRHECRTP